jgi:solute carrier family 25 carnitine/acylcarnitine transporter 20/29
MTCNYLQYKGVIDCGVRTARANGFMGLYRGMTITLMRDVPSFASYFSKFPRNYL